MSTLSDIENIQLTVCSTSAEGTYKEWQASHHTIGRQTNILYTQLSMDSIHTCNIKNEENTMVFKSYIQHDLELFPGWINTRVVLE